MTPRPPTVWVLIGLLVVLAISAVLGGGSMMMEPLGSGHTCQGGEP